ncbi:hypothetical protein D3C75_946330 [compost metagenome]
MLVTLDAMDLQVLTAQQYRHIRGLLASDGELVHHLKLHILRDAVLPKACPIYAGGFAFEDLHVICANYLAVDVGQHPGQIGTWMLQHGVDPSHLVLCALAVVPSDDGLQHIAPIGWAFLIMRIYFR